MTRGQRCFCFHLRFLFNGFPRSLSGGSAVSVSVCESPETRLNHAFSSKIANPVDTSGFELRSISCQTSEEIRLLGPEGLVFKNCSMLFPCMGVIPLIPLSLPASSRQSQRYITSFRSCFVSSSHANVTRTTVNRCVTPWEKLVNTSVELGSFPAFILRQISQAGGYSHSLATAALRQS